MSISINIDITVNFKAFEVLKKKLTGTKGNFMKEFQYLS